MTDAPVCAPRNKGDAMKRLLTLIGLFCAATAWAGPSLSPKSCVQTQQDICVDTTPCKTFSGVTACLNGVALPNGATRVNASCWQYQATFTCEDSSSIDSCQPLRDRGCGQIGTTCLSTDPSGKCVTADFTFSCPDKPPTTKQETVCDTSYCKDGTGCFNTTSTPDKDFGQAAAMVEVSRQAGVYGVDPTKVEVFKGYLEECSVKVLGGTELKSCCKSSGGGGGYTNHAVLSAGLSAAGGIGGAYAKDAIKTGSSYVYDALYAQTDSALIDKGLTSMNSWASDLSSSANFGAYGFTFSFSAESGFAFVGFDPYSFAISIAIQMVTEWLSCTPDEQTLSMKRGQNLCVFVGSYCSSKIPVINVCIEVKQQSCCFNSILAKTVNRQGRAQLGLPANQCGGFNQSQLQAMDFSKMDFSEFIASLNVDSVNHGALNNQINSTVQQKVNTYYGQ